MIRSHCSCSVTRGQVQRYTAGISAAMDDVDIKGIVQKNFSRLDREMNAKDVVVNLFSAAVITFELKQKIANSQTTGAANVALLDFLYEHSDRDRLESFLEVLKADKVHPKHVKLAEDMRQELPPVQVATIEVRVCL